MKINNQSGNVLWLILLTIALLAALTIAVSNMSDSTEQTGDIERYRIHATSIMRHTSALRESIERLRMNGVGESEVSFEVTYLSSGMYTNANCASEDCLIYSSVGGGMNYERPNTVWLDPDRSADDHYGEWEFSGNNVINDVGTTRPDLIVYLGYLQPGLCAQIDAMLGIGSIPTDTDGFDNNGYTGSFSATEVIDNMDGQQSGCFHDNTDARGYTYYQVLIKR